MNDIGADLQAAYKDGYKAGLNAKQRTGYWTKCKRNIILADEPYTSWKWGWKCSECGCGGRNEMSEIEPQPEWLYCPYCGAKME